MTSEVKMPEPYAYEFWRSNGDGTSSQFIERGAFVQTAPNRWDRKGPPRDALPSDAITPLVLQSDALAAIEAARVEARAKAMEEAAQQWDECIYDSPGESIDIGAAIRSLAKEAP